MASDRPIAGANVTVRDAAGTERSATTDADGAWRVDGLAAGTYHVTIRAVGRMLHEADESVELAEEVNSVDRLAPEAAPLPLAPDGGTDTEDVEVHGEKPPREVTKFTMDQREISRIPGTNGDALRSLQNLPGVGRPPGLAGLLIVRGSAPQDTQYFIDGTPVPIVYHFGGLSSVVPTEMLKASTSTPATSARSTGARWGASSMSA